MRALPPLTLTSEDKIDALRQLDEFHFWHSLDDVRICQRCHQRISGWQIEIVELAGAHDALRLQCPTPNCESSPGEWIYADPVLAARIHNGYHPSTPTSPHGIGPESELEASPEGRPSIHTHDCAF